MEVSPAERGIDSGGAVLDILVQSRRNKKAALKLMRKLLKTHGFVPNSTVTDKRASYELVQIARIMRNDFSQPTPSSTTPSTSNGI